MPRLVKKPDSDQTLLCVNTDIEVIIQSNHCRDMPLSSQPRGQYLNSLFKRHLVQVLYQTTRGNK